MNRPGILFVGNFLSARGASRQVCEDLADRLEDRGWRVKRTSSQSNRPGRLLGMILSTGLRRGEYAVANIDIFSGPSFAWAEVVSRFLRLLGKPFVLALHGGRLPEFARSHAGRVRRVLGWADAVVAPSSFLADRMAEYRDFIQIIPNSVELSRYPFRRRDDAKPKMVWLRAFDSIYNPEMAPVVLQIVRERIPAANLLMVGPEKHENLSMVKRVAEKVGVLDAVEFHGAVSKDRVPKILDQADIFLNTTNIDNTPVSIIEAMACGLCVVSTNVGGIPYMLDHEQEALLVPPDDPAAMAAAVQRILTENGLAGRLSENARKNAEQRDWSVALPQWERLFIEVAGGSLGSRTSGQALQPHNRAIDC